MKPLTNQFLLPLPNQDGSYFSGSLTYICSHNQDGAAGLIVNRQAKFDLNELLALIENPLRMDSPPMVFEGGPVEMSSPSILHTDDVMVEGSIAMENDLALTMVFEEDSFEVLLNRIAKGKGPKKYLVLFGHAGWSEGQLDRELNDNVWLTCPSSHELIFDVPVDLRAQQAADAIGIDLDLLSGDSTGNA